MIKASAGGGGMGMAVVVRRRPTWPPSTTRSPRSPSGLFGDASVFVERYFPRVRHVEVQILGSGRRPGAGPGRAGLLGAAPQPEGRRGDPVAGPRRPSCAPRCWPPPGRPARPSATRAPGTVEFLLGPAIGDGRAEFFFLEMNTRLQVEHPITEAVLGIDLVRGAAADRRRRGAGLRPRRR